MDKNNQQKELATMLIEAMEQGSAPWQRPWSSSQLSLRNGVTGHLYSEINVLLLAFMPFRDPRYCTL
jgi:antirestriction protein ArdC